MGRRGGEEEEEKEETGKEADMEETGLQDCPKRKDFRS